MMYIRLSFYWGGKVDVSVCVCFSPIPLLSDQEVFFSMTFFTWIDFNNARISCQKTLIFELYSMFLVIITFAFLHPFIDNSQESYAKIKKPRKKLFHIKRNLCNGSLIIISYKNKSLQWLSHKCAWNFLSMNSIHELIAVFLQRGTCIESICLRKENQRYFCQDADFRSSPSILGESYWWWMLCAS